MTTKFYVELPVDEYGDTTMERAVVEAKLEWTKDSRDRLVPVAPRHFVANCPEGWYRDCFGGWAEVEGPARLLSFEQYQALITSLSEEAKANAKGGCVTLRTGETVPRALFGVVMSTLRQLIENDKVAFLEAVMIARDPSHGHFGNPGKRLEQNGLLEHGKMPIGVQQTVLAASEGEVSDLRLVSPVAMSGVIG